MIVTVAKGYDLDYIWKTHGPPGVLVGAAGRLPDEVEGCE